MSNTIVQDLNTIKTARDNMKLALEGKGQTVSKDIRTYAQAISNIPQGGGGSGDVKLFENIQAMQNDPNPVDEGLAIIYYNHSSNLTENDEFQIGTFPETVTLPTAVTGYIEIGFSPVESGEMFDCWGNLNSTRYSINCYTDNGDIRIEYTSSDGITYTRTRFSKNNQEISGTEMDFGVVVKFGNRWGEAEWNDAVGYFTIVGGSAFDGLYQYTNKTNSYGIARTQFNADEEKVYNGVFYGPKGAKEGVLQNTTNLTTKQILTKAEIYDKLSYLEINENITDLSALFRSKSFSNIPYFDTSNVTNMAYMFQMCNNLTGVPNYDTSNVTNMGTMFSECSNLASVPNFNTSNVTNMWGMFDCCYNLTSVPNYDTSNVTCMWGMLQGCYNLINVPNFNTDNVTNMGQMFFGCNNLANVPNFNTSNATHMAAMFADCNNLTDVPNYDTSNVTSMSAMFRNCNSLISVPNFNTSNVKTMSNMFSGCNNLSSEGYANIANILPLATNLDNQYISNIGLNILNFTDEQKRILGNKKYVEAIPYTINTSNVSSYWNIYHE